MILDIDSFKNINDTFGHDAGDRALEGFANTLRESIRSSDILARLGGEEFGIILPNTGKVDAKVTAEKLRLAVEQQRLVVAETQEVSLTVSIGVSTVDKRINNFDALLKEADTALYQAKNRGRNIIVSSEDK